MSTFEPLEFKTYQTGAAWSGVERIKAVNIKPGKSNYHIAVVMDVLHEMYPHPNKTDMNAYDTYMEKAVRHYQKSLGHDQTGVLTIDELNTLAQSSGKFMLV
jgi:murein L,D-transpeptidase YcbB/YkuD